MWVGMNVSFFYMLVFCISGPAYVHVHIFPIVLLCLCFTACLFLCVGTQINICVCAVNVTKSERNFYGPWTMAVNSQMTDMLRRFSFVFHSALYANKRLVLHNTVSSFVPYNFSIISLYIHTLTSIKCSYCTHIQTLTETCTLGLGSDSI